EVKFNVFKAMKMNDDLKDCYRVDICDRLITETFKTSHVKDPLEDTILNRGIVVSKEARECLHAMNIFPHFGKMNFQFEALDRPAEAKSTIKPSIEGSTYC
ncbi:hypothetical protein TorRG33x02_323700, partial [Trema orientale]